MLGDLGVSLYKGPDTKIREHVRKCYEIVYGVAEHSKVGMKFSELFDFAINFFEKEMTMVGWMTTTNDPLKGTNLGHTVPGSLIGEDMKKTSFDEIKDFITTKRVYINRSEQFIIPETCAFTVESRLVDKQKTMPNIFFHFIVTFLEGRKEILTNFDEIFRAAGMEYVL